MSSVVVVDWAYDVKCENYACLLACLSVGTILPFSELLLTAIGSAHNPISQKKTRVAYSTKGETNHGGGEERMLAVQRRRCR